MQGWQIQQRRELTRYALADVARVVSFVGLCHIVVRENEDRFLAVSDRLVMIDNMREFSQHFQSVTANLVALRDATDGKMA